MMQAGESKQLLEQNEVQQKHWINFFDLILFMGVIFNSSSENPWCSVSIVARRNFMKADTVQLLVSPVVI